MSETKRIGASKYKNKQKYKNKYKVVPKTNEADELPHDEDKIVINDDYPFRRRGLESNWHRYEFKADTQDTIDVARDFSAIVSAPISQGSYFQFKSDKNLDRYEEETIESELFKLDMNLLNLSMAAIPFHVRCDIEEKNFCADDLNIFNASARKANEQYEKVLQNLESKLIQEKPNDNIKEESSPHINTKIQENLEISNTICETTGTVDKESSSSANDEKDKLEKWLDNILDD